MNRDVEEVRMRIEEMRKWQLRAGVVALVAVLAVTTQHALADGISTTTGNGGVFVQESTATSVSTTAGRAESIGVGTVSSTAGTGVLYLSDTPTVTIGSPHGKTTILGDLEVDGEIIRPSWRETVGNGVSTLPSITPTKPGWALHILAETRLCSYKSKEERGRFGFAAITCDLAPGQEKFLLVGDEQLVMTCAAPPRPEPTWVDRAPLFGACAGLAIFAAFFLADRLRRKV